MAIITLTTDLGHRDFYQAALKGTLLNYCPDARIVDISHQISCYNIPQAAFILKNCYRYFPKGSIHIVGVDPDYDQHPIHLALEHEGYFFIGPDNGIFSLLFDAVPDCIFRLTIAPNCDLIQSPLLDIYTQAAAHLAKGEQLTAIGVPASGLHSLSLMQPVVSGDIVRGRVVYVDSFQNVMTNITRSLFEELRAGRDFEIIFKRNEQVSLISKRYCDVPEGEKLAMFNMTGCLEIAINKGNAAGLLGLKVGDMVRLVFKESGTINRK